MKKFYSKEKEKIWLDKVPNNLVLKVFKNKDKKKIKKKKRWLSFKVLDFIGKKCRYITKKLPWKYINLFGIAIKRKLYNYSVLILLLIIYLIIWHPGFNNTYVPVSEKVKHSNWSVSNNYNLYPPESVYLLIDIQKSWIELFINQKNIISFPVSLLPPLLKGKYHIEKFIKFKGNKAVILLKNEVNTFFIKQEKIRIRASTYIDIQYKYWKLLVQYLKIGNFVIIR